MLKNALKSIFKSPPTDIPPLSAHDRWQVFYILGFLAISSLGVHLINITSAWYLVSQDGGATVLGASLAGVSLFIVVAQPYYGMLLDTHNRKTVLLCVMAGCMTISIATFFAVGTKWQFVFMPLSVAFGMLYYNFTTPCINSIKQEIFPIAQQRTITYYIETTMAGSATVGAVLTIFMVQVLNFEQSLWFNMACLITATGLIARLKYTPTKRTAKTQPPIQRIVSGLSYIKQRPFFMVHTAIATAPFVLMGTVIFLNPVFLSQILNAPDESLPITRACMSMGSFMAGVTLHRLMRTWKTRHIVYFTCIAMGGIMLARTHIDQLMAFYMISGCIGFFNSGSRIGRMNLMIDHIQNDYTGRVYTSIQSIIMLGRVGIISGATVLLAHMGADNALMITWYFAIPMLLLILLGIKIPEPPTIQQCQNTTKQKLNTTKSNTHGGNSL